jgi:hypothetical protein
MLYTEVWCRNFPCAKRGRDALISLLSSRVYMTDRQIDQNRHEDDQLQRYTLPGILFYGVVVRKASQLQITTLPEYMNARLVS